MGDATVGETQRGSGPEAVGYGGAIKPGGLSRAQRCCWMAGNHPDSGWRTVALELEGHEVDPDAEAVTLEAGVVGQV